MLSRLLAAARARFEGLHGFAAPSKLVPMRPPAPPRSPVVQVYHRITAVEGDRWLDEGTGREEVRFRHDFAKHAAPSLWADANGRGFLYGGRWHVTQHGIEDKPMRHNMYGLRSNPDLMGAVSGALTTGLGLAAGVALAAGVRAIPESRLGDTAKDLIVVGVAGAAAILPNAGMAKMFGVSALVGAAGSVAQRRWDWIGMGERWVGDGMGRFWTLVGLGAPAATNALPGGDTPNTQRGLPNTQGRLPETVWQ